MFQLFDIIQNVNSIGISGHVRPDGDCVGSCMALYNYIMRNYNSDGKKQVDVYLEPIPEVFSYLEGVSEIKHECNHEQTYDLFISLDNGDLERLGKAATYFKEAKQTINIDHHISNTEFAQINHVIPDASSTCEVLFGLLEEEKIDSVIANCLYTGLVHDTGVFKHSNTSRKTMEIAGILLEKGVNSSKIIDESFYQKTYIQNQILGRCLLESMLLFEGTVIVSTITKQQMAFYHATSHDLDGIVDQLRITKGVEVAMFIYETEPSEYKVSLRSNGDVNVSKIATYFGGGGHIKAAGCSMKGRVHDVINNIMVHIEHQLKELNLLELS